MNDSENVLSKQELKVLELMAAGYTSELIAGKLSIAKSTVQTHRRNMLRKTGMRNTHHIVAWAYKKKILKSLLWLIIASENLDINYLLVGIVYSA
jgi:DNA-binding CsgD family transcriptional regulator